MKKGGHPLTVVLTEEHTAGNQEQPGGTYIRVRLTACHVRLQQAVLLVPHGAVCAFSGTPNLKPIRTIPMPTDQ